MSRIVPVKRLFFAFFDKNPGVFAISVTGQKSDKKSVRRGGYGDGQIFYACRICAFHRSADARRVIMSGNRKRYRKDYERPLPLPRAARYVSYSMSASAVSVCPYGMGQIAISL